MRDNDVAFFPKNYAIDNEILGESRTYFTVDTDEYEQGRLAILAFFTPTISTTGCSFEARGVHAGGNGGRRGVKVLHLLGGHAKPARNVTAQGSAALRSLNRNAVAPAVLVRTSTC